MRELTYQSISFDPPSGWLHALRHVLRQPSPLVLDSASEGPLSRESVLSFAPAMLFSATGQTATFQRGNHSARIEGDPLALFGRVERHARDEFSLQGENIPRGYIGGWAGLLSFELRSFIEKLPPPKFGGPLFPDLHAGFYPWCLVLDHVSNTCELRLLAGMPGGHRDVRELAGDLRELFTRPVPVDGNPQSPFIEYQPKSVGATYMSPLQTTTREQWLEQVSAVKRYIYEGEIYQANLTRMVRYEGDFSAPALYEKLRTKSPAPFGGYFNCGLTRCVLSSSPELFLSVRNGVIETRPIKGTRPRGSTREQDERLKSELLSSEKDHAELVMIVDLERNDLGRICKAGSVRVPELCALHSYANVHHLEATVQGELRAGVDFEQIIRATFPGGSISGAPKKRALEIIHELEPVRRGPYTGSLFALSFNGDLMANILIRTLLTDPRGVSYHVGCGITADSDPAAEWDESLAKARGMEEALG
ncbi:MAG: anthranilate synthase component I family protein [Planctomycetes bacterium]|nr:anthranilate synthase component I family protein [Planctomycetota bacterium]